jgi:hypothetical protein
MEGGTKTGDIDNIFGGRLRAAFSFVFAPKIGALPQRRLGCLLMAQSGHADMLNQCPLLGGKADIVSGACCIARFRLGCHPPRRSHRPHASPVRIGAVATSGYDFREGYPFAMTPRGEAACHSSSVSFTSFRGTQG